eukprot:TRINITY_DN14496_c0_g1_i1.p1 TRINITY_DN14496_c0_g1~~TRINITY_DN14496_c0_g1_i1.p1  ORF type:complete len:110 (-),score=9.56 TRINITY_DN14496_c0_g1_i1:5-313(-)
MCIRDSYKPFTFELTKVNDNKGFGRLDTAESIMIPKTARPELRIRIEDNAKQVPKDELRQVQNHLDSLSNEEFDNLTSSSKTVSYTNLTVPTIQRVLIQDVV